LGEFSTFEVETIVTISVDDLTVQNFLGETRLFAGFMAGKRKLLPVGSGACGVGLANWLIAVTAVHRANPSDRAV